MPAETRTVPTTFFSVSLEMLSTDRVLPCDLWIQHGEKEPVLYRAAQLPIEEEQLERLRRSGVHSVLVSFDDARAWADYLGQRLHEEVGEESEPLESRLERFLGASEAMMRGVLSNPTSPAVRAQIGHMSEAVVEIMRRPDALVTAVRMMRHDYYTYSHSVHVALYGVALARARGVCDPAQLKGLGRGFLMHDVGKMALSQDLLNKRGKLTAGEFETIKTHSEKGLAILREGGWDDPQVTDIVHCHHERLDGSGYPRGLRDEQLSLGPRIAAIGDAFDAMTTDRPYARARSAVDAVKVLFSMPRAYDQELLKTFVKTLLDSGGGP